MFPWNPDFGRTRAAPASLPHTCCCFPHQLGSFQLCLIMQSDSERLGRREFCVCFSGNLGFLPPNIRDQTANMFTEGRLGLPESLIHEREPAHGSRRAR